MLTTISIGITVILICQYGEAFTNSTEIEQMRNSYDEFIHQYRKSNMTEEEYELRFEIFRKNLQLIDELNSGNDSIVYGITQFADWTDEEYRNYMRAGQSDNGRERRGLSTDHRNWVFVKWTGHSIPSHWDWRDYGAVTHIKSQSYQCNSCWAYAVTAVVESLYAIKYGQIIDISEAEMLDCDFTNDGCYSGNTRRAMGRGKFDGFTSTSSYPHMNGNSYSCPTQGEIFVNTLYALSPDANTVAWFTANYGPVALNLALPESYKFYKSGIMRDSYECWQMRPNHAATVVGFGEEDGTQYWIMKNSWGGWWGEGGFFRIERGINACQVETFATSGGL